MLKRTNSRDSEEDLINIWWYVAQDQPVNADRLLDRFDEVLGRLAEMLNMGVDRLVRVSVLAYMYKAKSWLHDRL